MARQWCSRTKAERTTIESIYWPDGISIDTPGCESSAVAPPAGTPYTLCDACRRRLVTGSSARAAQPLQKKMRYPREVGIASSLADLK